MDQIIADFRDPAWWLSCLFPIFLMWLIRKVFRKLEPAVRNLIRASKLQNLRKVKSLRWDPLQIQYLIGRASANYTLFVGSIILVIVLVTFTPARSALKSIPLFMLFTSPIYLFEILWLISDSTAREAIKARRKIGRRLRLVAKSRKG